MTLRDLAAEHGIELIPEMDGNYELIFLKVGSYADLKVQMENFFMDCEDHLGVVPKISKPAVVCIRKVEFKKESI